MSFVALVTVVVNNYDSAIAFYCGVLGFELTEASPSETNEGRPKRWVVATPPGGQTGLLLAQADSPTQAQAVGNQTAGRVGFFLRVDRYLRQQVGPPWTGLNPRTSTQSFDSGLSTGAEPV